MPWLDSVPPAAPLLKVETTAKTANLKWQESNPKREPLRYVVYRFVNNEAINLERNDRIVSIQQGTDFTDPEAKKYKQCTYLVTAMDRTWNESKPSNAVKTSP
jgi:fibronectin type 3 domain-containing protein